MNGLITWKYIVLAIRWSKLSGALMYDMSYFCVYSFEYGSMLLQNGVVVVVFLKILWMFDVLQSEVGNKNVSKYIYLQEVLYSL